MEHVKFTSARICSKIMHFVWQIDKAKQNITLSSERKENKHTQRCLYAPPVFVCSAARHHTEDCCGLAFPLRSSTNCTPYLNGLCAWRVWCLVHHGGMRSTKANQSKPKHTKNKTKNLLFLIFFFVSHLFQFHMNTPNCKHTSFHRYQQINKPSNERNQFQKINRNNSANLLLAKLIHRNKYANHAEHFSLTNV